MSRNNSEAFGLGFLMGLIVAMLVVLFTSECDWKPKRAPCWLDLSGVAWAQLTHSLPSRIVAEMRRID